MKMIDNTHSLKEIYEELCKGNINFITLEIKRFISEMALKLYQPASSALPDYREDLKYLILICNILYNRTSIDVLPVEDGLYDILLERYKDIDPNFQVGSFVVDFPDMNNNTISNRPKEIIKPIYFVERKPLDDFGSKYASDICGVDHKHLLTFDDIFYINNSQNEQKISKRKHNTAHNHPDLIGTLDKCKFVLDSDAASKEVYSDPSVKILERDWFRKHIDTGIIREDQELLMSIELKYDGISVEADCTDQVISARTRGDTAQGQAADITPILQGYRFPHNDVLADREVGVKFEAIMTKEALYEFNLAKGKNYSNCRTAIIGLFGSSDAYKYRDYITLIPLALDRDNVPEVNDRLEEINLLNRLYISKGQPLRFTVIQGNYKTCLFLIKKFVDWVTDNRSYFNFMFDGIVISYLDNNIRAKLGRQNYINKYQMAVKFEPLVRQTRVIGYSYQVGQDGRITPMIHYDPVEFFGTIHNKSSMHSYERFKQCNFKPNQIIDVTYVNDVMPYVTNHDCTENDMNTNPPIEFTNICPECGSPITISPTGKTAYCENKNCIGRKITRMTNMLQKLNLKGFADSTIRDLGVYSFKDLFELSLDQLQILGPTNAANFYEAMQALKKTYTYDYQIIGALGFTGIASKTWKIIFKEFSMKEIFNSIRFEKSHAFIMLSGLKGIGESTARTIIEEYPLFENDIDYIIKNFSIVETVGYEDGIQIRFTGCRPRELAAKLQSMGFDADCDAGVTKSTAVLVVPYEGYKSTKINKVSENCLIIPVDKLEKNFDKFLGKYLL